MTFYSWSDCFGLDGRVVESPGVHVVLRSRRNAFDRWPFLFRSHLGRQHTGDQNLTKISQLHRTNLGRRKEEVGDGWLDGELEPFCGKHGCFSEISRNNSENFRSGTGGFSFWGESASPIYDDLNGKEAMELFDLNESLFSDSQVIPLRLRRR